MRRMNPIEEPHQAVVDGRYVPHPHETGIRIARRLEIEPSSTHLLMGGVGAGKSTELLAAQRALMNTPDMLALYADVPTYERIDAAGTALLPLVAARVLVESLGADQSGTLPPAVRALRELVVGQWVDPHEGVEEAPDDDDGYVWAEGLSRPPVRDRRLDAIRSSLEAVLKFTGRDVVVLLDGLDRMPVDRALADALVIGARTLHSVGVGVVVVGPQQLRFGGYRGLIDQFTGAHMHGAMDREDAASAAFLEHVLSARASDEILPASSRKRLVQLSGGVLRDLVALARDAGEEAYAGGAEQILEPHLDRAADRFGRGRVLGMTKEMAERLVALRPQFGMAPRMAFTPHTDLDIELILQGVLVEVAGTPPKYIVHPAVEPLIPSLRRSA